MSAVWEAIFGKRRPPAPLPPVPVPPSPEPEPMPDPAPSPEPDPEPDPIVLPSRPEVMAHLHADIAPSDREHFPFLVNGTTSQGDDILGTWHWLDFDDDLFARAATAYLAAGHRLVPCSFVVTNYQGRTFDLTQDVSLLRSRLERTYRAGLIPMPSLSLIDADGHGAETVARLPLLLDAIGDLLVAAFPCWELRVDGGPAAYSPHELAQVLALTRRACPDVVLGIEFLTPEGREPITYDGRAESDARSWWRDGPGRYVDVLMLEVGYDRLEDRDQFVDDVAGAVCRWQGPFPLREHWPDGRSVPRAMLDNWRGPDYGLYRRVMLFEYAAAMRLTSAAKRAYRELCQAMIPTLAGWGEG